jgi:hypothetical protein
MGKKAIAALVFAVTVAFTLLPAWTAQAAEDHHQVVAVDTAEGQGTTGTTGTTRTTGTMDGVNRMDGMNGYRPYATNNNDNWGWLGLLGLIGLAGLWGRNRDPRTES